MTTLDALRTDAVTDDVTLGIYSDYLQEHHDVTPITTWRGSLKRWMLLGPAVVAVHPIRVLDLQGVAPMPLGSVRYATAWRWDRAGSSTWGERQCVPGVILDRMKYGRGFHVSQPTWDAAQGAHVWRKSALIHVEYDTRRLAVDALHAAALEWAMSAAS